MPNGRITKRSVDTLLCPPGRDREVLWDDDLAGFGVVAFPSGAKSYVVQYRRNGNSRRATVGRHGRLTPDEARSEAKKLLGAVETGLDPIAEKKAARAAVTVKEVAARYMRDQVLPKKKSGTSAEYLRLLEQHVIPQLGSKKLIELRHSHVVAAHLEISRKAKVTANRAVSVLSALWNWAARLEIVSASDNPVKGLERNREQGRERYLTEEEFRRLGAVLNEAETLGLLMEIKREGPKSKHSPKPGTRRAPLDPFAAAAIRLLLFTGARLREVLDLRWSDIDLERGIIFLPDSKTGRKPIYISEPADAVLKAIPRVAGNDFVIAGGLEGRPRSDLKRPWAAIRKAAGL